MLVKYWKLKPNDPALQENLSRDCGYSPLISRLFVSKGIDTKQAVKSYIEPALLDSPFSMIDMDLAAARIREALQLQHPILICGDYDCDGITATALLFSYLEEQGASISYYIPSREKDGYGLSKETVRGAHEAGYKLIITVDNGISCAEEVDLANELGLDVIITDHHKPPEVLPKAVAVVDPHRSDCPSSFQYLCGVGVAFKLVCALEGEECAEELLEYYSDILCIGTLADVVPIIKENRSIVQHGLSHLSSSSRPGIRALLAQCGISDDELSSRDVSFTLAPRINACGRMGSAYDALELLLSDDYEQAGELSVKLCEYNTERRKIEAAIFTQVVQTIEARGLNRLHQVLVVAEEGWHHGVVGIVASRVAEKYGKPCILLSMKDGIAVGSGRSVEGFSLINALRSADELMIRYGGHTQAVGLTIAERRIDDLMKRLDAYARQVMAPASATLTLDCELLIEELTIENVQALSLFEPFGAENEQPMFLIRGVSLDAIYPLKMGKHLRLRFKKGRSSFYGVYFGMQEQKFLFSPADKVDLAVQLGVDTFRDEPRVTVYIRDMRPADFCEEDFFASKKLYESVLQDADGAVTAAKADIPTRNDVALVYRYFQQKQVFFVDQDALAVHFLPQLSCAKTLFILDVLKQTQLIIPDDEDPGRFVIASVKEKKDLMSAPIMKKLLSS